MPTARICLIPTKKMPNDWASFFDIRIYAYLTLNTPLFILSFIELINLLL
ncbi:hypothetical protein AO370_1713 [Moraxella catarrhalis]|uniref:Uncharacterized protein n=1 Tax=Moraxella catarrhalis TaxID=480 RepID=A0AB36DMJ8_MORCA|nr:hypothetical protein AO370_1713 [Moraxella catarrhalis]